MPRTHVGTPPGSVAQAIQTELAYIGSHQLLGVFVWGMQEKTKGRAETDGLLGSTHGGWKFNYHPPYLYVTNGTPAFMTPEETAPIANSQLATNAFFDVTSPSFGTSDTALFGANGSQYAQNNGNRLLADAIPALTLPVGANHVQRLAPDGLPDRNFDMQALYENGWPNGRPARSVGAVAAGEWHHSDFRAVAYPFNYRLFEKFVQTGNLK